jgi:selenocysteine lyase/cysteine desulfurase
MASERRVVHPDRMRISRRTLIKGTATVPAVAAATAAAAQFTTTLPARSAFVDRGLAYLDNGSQHPLSIGARRAVDAFHAQRMADPGGPGYTLPRDEVLGTFARLINADAAEVSFVQSTTAGEQAVIRALRLPMAGGHVVTDRLHFFGSIPLYRDLARRGVEVTWIEPVDGRIPLAAIRAAMRNGTRLVAVSQVSTINGFEHDLKAVCDIAHAAGALVYADIVHAAGCVPVDVRASGVDFAACASYKWLMGDFGLGFLYVRKDVLPLLSRETWGYYATTAFQHHAFPQDLPPAPDGVYAFSPDTRGAFMGGTHANAVIAQLGYSLGWIEALGVPAIQGHAQRLIAHLREELPRHGYRVLTPPESCAPVLAAHAPDAGTRLAAPMRAAGIRLTLTGNRLRLTPSVQNDHADIDRFLAALPRA